MEKIKEFLLGATLKRPKNLSHVSPAGRTSKMGENGGGLGRSNTMNKKPVINFVSEPMPDPSVVASLFDQFLVI